MIVVSRRIEICITEELGLTSGMLWLTYDVEMEMKIYISNGLSEL